MNGQRLSSLRPDCAEDGIALCQAAGARSCPSAAPASSRARARGATGRDSPLA